MNISAIIAILMLMLFFASIAYFGASRKTYLLFVLIGFPYIDLLATPVKLGAYSVFDVITLIAVLLYAKDLFSSTRGNMFYVYCFFCFLVLTFFGSFASAFAASSIIHIPKVVTPFIYAALLMRELKGNPYFFNDLIKSLKFAAAVGLIYMAMQLMVGVKFTHYSELNTNVMDASGTRYPGFFIDSQLNGSFWCMISFLFLLNPLSPRNPTTKNYWQFALIAAAALTAGSRSPMLGMAIGLVFLVIFVGGRFRPVFSVIGIVAAALIALFAENITVFKRFSEFDDSLDFRASLWADAWKIFFKEYKLGIGLENYRDYIMLYSQDQFLLLDNDEISYLVQPESGYLKWLVEFGIFGTILLFLMILVPIIRTVVHNIQGYKNELLFFFLAPLLVWFVSFTSLYTFVDKRIVVLVVTNVVVLASYPYGILLQPDEGK